MLYLIIAFLLVFIVFAYVLSVNHVKTGDDFLVAGRRLTPTLLCSTLLAANIGAGSTVGAVGLGYSYGFSAWWWVGSAAIGTILLGLTVGPKIWQLAKQYNFYTVGDYLEYRYDRRVRMLIATILWLAALVLFAAQLLAMGVIFQAVTGLNRMVGSLLGGVVVIIYFSVGGLFSTARINFLQIVVIFFSFLAVIFYLLYQIGGYSGLQLKLAASMDEHILSFTSVGSGQIFSWLLLLVPAFIISPGLLQKIYGGKNKKVVVLGTVTSGIILLFFALIPALLGVLAFIKFPTLIHPELALPSLIAEQLPFILASILLAAILFAELSTCDAILFMMSSSVTVDYYKAYINPSADGKKLLLASRIIALITGIVAVTIALSLSSVIEAMTLFYTLLVVTLWIPLLGGLYVKQLQTLPVLITIVLTVIATVLFYVLTQGTGISWLSVQLFGLLVSIVLISLLYPVTKNKNTL